MGDSRENTTPPFRAVRLDELERIDVAGVTFRPLRRRLGVRSFGVNAFTADEAGQHVIEEHDESGSGAGGHEEMYVVISGRATFRVGGEQIDAPAGTAVLVPELTTRRSAVAAEPGTTVLVVGGPADRSIPTSPFEFWFAAEPAYTSGDHERAIEIASAGLEEWPDHGHLHYQLACYHALAGHPDAALDHLQRAVADRPETAEFAQTDEDLDSIRGLPGFPQAPG
ncbi:MAG: TPR end-of-group domain-containing protein [Gaiellales bacterium]